MDQKQISEKNIYVLIERIGDGPDINGCDTWLCPWSDWQDFLISPLEEVEIGTPFSVKLTVLEMYDEEFQDYCEENSIEWE